MAAGEEGEKETFSHSGGLAGFFACASGLSVPRPQRAAVAWCLAQCWPHQTRTEPQ